MISFLYLVYGLLYLVSDFILGIIIAYVKIHHVSMKICMYISLLLIGSLLFRPLVLETLDYYGKYKIILILLLLFTIFANNIHYFGKNITQRMSHNNKEDKLSILLNNLNFLEIWCMCIVVCLLVLSIFGITYWYQYHSNYIVNLIAAFPILTFSLILVMLMYFISYFIIMKVFNNKLTNLSIIKSILKKNFRYSKLKSNKIKLISEIGVIIILLILSYVSYPNIILSRIINGTAYHVHIHSQYPIFDRYEYNIILMPTNSKCQRKTIKLKNEVNRCNNFNRYLYTCDVKNKYLIFHLKNKKLIKRLGTKIISFRLYSFNNRKYYFVCRRDVPGYNPLNIRLVLYHH